MRKALLAVLALLLASNVALACDDYRGEIIKHVVDVCFIEIIKTGDVTEYLTEDEALEMLKAMQEKEVEGMIDAVNLILDGRNMRLEQRKSIYKISANTCIEAA